jgi:hypothetical protein
MNKKKASNTVVIFIIFCIGVTFGKLFDWGYFVLTKEISIIDALSLFITIILAIYITKILEKEVQENRIKKDLYINKISDIEDSLKDLEQIIKGDDILYNTITNQIHFCRIKKNSVFNSILSDSTIDDESLQSLNREVSSYLQSLKNLSTNTPLTQQLNPDILVENGKVIYTQRRIIEINSLINSINEKLFEVKIRINIK